MYIKTTVEDTISLPPKYLGEDIKKGVKEMLRLKYERTLDKDLGIILAIFDVRDVSGGYILPSDPNIYYKVTFDILSYKVEVDEVVVGEVVEMAEFGCFVKIGPIQGLLHISQMIDEYIKYDKKLGYFTNAKGNKNIKKGDILYAKVSTVSMKNNIKDIKIALTTRPAGLGKPEWLKITEKPTKKKGEKNG